MADFLAAKDAFNVVSRYAQALEPMWPSVLFRIVAAPADESLIPPYSVLASHLQGSPTPRAPDGRARVRNPLVLHGNMSVHDMVQMLTAWSNGDDYLLHHWTLKPPTGLGSLFWQQDIPADISFQLIEMLPSYQSRYRLARLSGGGDSLDVELRNRLIEAIYSVRQSPQQPVQWSREYLAADWQVQNTFVAIELPTAVGVEATYDAATTQLNVAVHHRPPLTPADFEVRVGSDGWDASRPFHPLQSAGTDQDGWDISTCHVPLPPGGTAKVWTHWIASHNDYDWEITVDLGRPDSRELRRERFLTEWYRLARVDLGAEVRPRDAKQQKGDRGSDALEVAISNILGARGMSVLFGGKVVETPGVDLVAFDAAEGVAYAMSITIDNKVSEKLRQWLRVADSMRRALEPLWTVRPVILTSDPEYTLPPGDMSEAAQAGVRVLSGDDLAVLQDSPADIQAFAELLGRDW